MLQEDAGQHELNDQIDSQLQKRFDSSATFFGRGIVSTRKGRTRGVFFSW
jgi:hypothetical protein